MKKLGIVGGVAWPSTIDYYRAICRLSVAHHKGKSIRGPAPVPEMTIESLNINKSFSLRGSVANDDASWEAYDGYFRDALLRLERSGAEVAIIASSTPHNRFQSITRGIRIPVISIFDAVADNCAQLGITEMLILGTAPTMDMAVFSEVLARRGICGFSPARPEERAEIAALIAELYADRGEGAAQRILGVIEISFPKKGKMRAACLACTELPLAFPEMEQNTSAQIDEVLLINTTMIHAKAAFSAALQ